MERAVSLAWRAVVTAAAGVVAWRACVQPVSHLGGGESDFGAYYRAAQHVLTGSSPYLEPAYLYPPPLALLMAPLGLLSYPAARWTWYAITLVIVSASLVVCTLILRRAGRPGGIAVLAFAAAPALPHNLVLGQLQPLLLLVLAAAFRCQQRGKERSEGALIGLASALKIWPLVLLADSWLGKRRSVVASALTCGAALVLTSLLVVRFLSGPTAPPRPHYLIGTPGLLNTSIAGVAMRAAELPRRGGEFPENWQAAGSVPGALVLSRREALGGICATAVTGILALAWLLRSRWLRTQDAGGRALAWAALITLGLILVPVSWYHYHWLHALTLVLIAVGLERREVRGLVASFLIVTIAHQPFHNLYLEKWGWSAAHPLLLLGLSGVPLLGGALLFLLIVSFGNSRKSVADATTPATSHAETT